MASTPPHDLIGTFDGKQGSDGDGDGDGVDRGTEKDENERLLESLMAEGGDASDVCAAVRVNLEGENMSEADIPLDHEEEVPTQKHQSPLMRVHAYFSV
ncbi:unnamed protein product, partial [Brassica oleracea var. botrytis]